MELSWLVSGRGPWPWHRPWVRTVIQPVSNDPHQMNLKAPQPEKYKSALREHVSQGWECVWVAIWISVPLVADSGHLLYSSYRINIFPSALHNILKMGNFILGFRSPVRSYRIYCANRQWVSSGRELVTRAPMQPTMYQSGPHPGESWMWCRGYDLATGLQSSLRISGELSCKTFRWFQGKRQAIWSRSIF